MDDRPMFLDCPAYLDECGAVRCALPAAVMRRYFARSTSEPVEHVVIRCPVGHLFNAPIEFLGLPPEAAPTVRTQQLRRAAEVIEMTVHAEEMTER